MNASFYDRPVLEVARDLLGCVVVRGPAAGVIVETEAYHQSEPACHAFAGLTPRTEVLFGPPGRAYVYRSYGIHAMLNAVCEGEGVGAAVLIRALMPLDDVAAMARRRGRSGELELCSGPGKLCQALDVRFADNGCSLEEGPVRIVGPPGPDWAARRVEVGVRVGITRATELPWRFAYADCAGVSRPRVGRGRAAGRRRAA